MRYSTFDAQTALPNIGSSICSPSWWLSRSGCWGLRHLQINQGISLTWESCGRLVKMTLWGLSQNPGHSSPLPPLFFLRLKIWRARLGRMLIGYSQDEVQCSGPWEVRHAPNKPFENHWEQGLLLFSCEYHIRSIDSGASYCTYTPVIDKEAYEE
jgi:hypothetical protein